MSKSVSHFTRGGQIWAHKVRMTYQVLKIASSFALLGSLMFILSTLLTHLSFQAVYIQIVSWWAELKLEMGDVFGVNNITITFYDFSSAQWLIWPAKDFLLNPQIQNLNAHVTQTLVWFLSGEAIKTYLLIIFMTFGVTFAYFFYGGKKSRLKKKERGGEIVTPMVLKRLLRGNGSEFNLDGLPLVKDKEPSHMLLTGTTGAGKTNCLHTLLPQIRDKKQKAIVVDLTGDFVSKYYRPYQDIILNPFDDRSVNWSPFAECETSFDYDSLAEAFIGGNPNLHDPFWQDSARIVFSAALRELSSQSLSELFRILTESSLSEFSFFLQKTKAASLVDEKGEKTTLSIRANLVSQISSLEYLKDTKNPFSIKKWIQEENDQWLFLLAMPNQRSTLRPLLTTWVDVAINGLMNLSPNYDRRLWFIADELPALGRLPSLGKGLAEARKYGGCFVLGIQDIPQLRMIYNTNGAQTIINQCNTKVFFRSTDPETCRYISQTLGEIEEKEVQENLSYGANTIRDGVSLNEIQKRNPLVLPTEISQLKDLDCYIKLPGDYPVTKMRMQYKSIVNN